MKVSRVIWVFISSGLSYHVECLLVLNVLCKLLPVFRYVNGKFYYHAPESYLLQKSRGMKVYLAFIFALSDISKNTFLIIKNENNRIHDILVIERHMNQFPRYNSYNSLQAYILLRYSWYSKNRNNRFVACCTFFNE